MLDGHLVEQVQDPFGEPVANLVVGDNVEKRHDLVDVVVDLPPGLRFAYASRRGVRAGCFGDCGVAKKPFAHRLATRELEAIEAAAKAQQRTAAGSACVPSAAHSGDDDGSKDVDPDAHRETIAVEPRSVKRRPVLGHVYERREILRYVGLVAQHDTDLVSRELRAAPLLSPTLNVSLVGELEVMTVTIGGVVIGSVEPRVNELHVMVDGRFELGIVRPTQTKVGAQIIRGALHEFVDVSNI